MPLMDLTKEELAALLSTWGEPKFRAAQVFDWLKKGVRPSEMRNLPVELREKLGTYPFGGASIRHRFVSELDGTVKYLFALEDGNLVEGVLMRYHYGNTVCISTQVGCAMGCRFCASTLDGCVRDLSAGEMLSFLAEIERTEPLDAGHDRVITNIVLMGSGEPLMNYANVVTFLKRVTSPDEKGVSPRNISLSTCGVVPRIYDFLKDAPHVTLSISLHAHSNEQRSALMPINHKYPIEELVQAARTYADTTGRRVIFEYALIDGTNASFEDAQALAKLLRGVNCHVNLIPLNPVKERELAGVSRKQANCFMEWLTQLHISATIRREMGADIEGACGQLRRRVLHDQNSLSK